jgi:DnaJ-class molecular chaperone
VWKRIGDDIVTQEIISLKQALCGFSRTRPGLDGEPVTLDVVDVLSPNQDRRVIGAGMPKRGGGRGDAIFKFSIAFPDRLTDDQKALVTEGLPD